MMSRNSIPWGRLSAEGVAIVASILLAFAIDAWWDDRKDRAEEQEILESLRSDFEVNQDEVEAVILTHETSVQSTAQLQALTDQEILALSPGSVENFLRYFANPRTFDAVRGSIDALISSGKLGILRDRQLREALTTFLNILEDAKEDREYMFQWSMIIWREVARNGGPYRKHAGNRAPDDCTSLPLVDDCYISSMLSYLPAATGDDLLRLRNNSVLMGYVNRNKENSIRYASEMHRARKQISLILDLLNRNLK